MVSEGLDVGSLGESRDSFGHVQFGSGQTTVAQVVVNYLNEVGLAAAGAARANVPGTDQRHSMAYASTVDLDEAYRVGQKAVELAAAGQSGYMATILREPGSVYRVRYDKVPLAEVANSERTFPAAWIAPSGSDVTDDFVRYAMPLVGEESVTLPTVGGRPRTRGSPKPVPRRNCPPTCLKPIASNHVGIHPHPRVSRRHRFRRLALIRWR